MFNCTFLAAITSTFLAVAVTAAAAEELLFFEKQDPKEKTTISLRIDGSEVTGYQTWQPVEQHGASGSLDGTREGDLIRATYSYYIEGTDQTEEQVFKLDGDDLLIGKGELTDPGDDGKLVLKDPTQLSFDKRLTRVPTSVPQPGTPARKAIMDAMREPVSKQIGQPVEFTGDLLVSGDWARFSGNAAITNGKPPRDENAEIALELDYFALLRKSEGQWSVLSGAFAGDIGPKEEARTAFPEAPWVLFE